MNNYRYARRAFRKNRAVLGASAAVTAAALAVAGAGPILAQDDDNADPPAEELEEGGEATENDDEDENGSDEELTEGDGGLTEGTGAINPDLSLDGAEVEILNLDDEDSEYAKFTFSRTITSVDSDSAFELSGFSPQASATAEDTQIVQGEPQSVLAAYEAGTDLESFTLAHVESGAVSDEAGRTNLPGTTELTGGGASVEGTDAPRLQAVSANDSIDQITYVYDRALDEASASAGDLGLYTSSGREISGSEIVATDKESVTVGFDSQVEDAVAYFSKADAVEDTRGLGNVPHTVGDDTAAPHLEDVSDLVGKTQFEFTFSEPVANVDEESFVVYTADGTSVKGSGVVQPSSDVVRIAFPETQLFGETITLAAVEAEAVTSNDGSDTPNTIASDVIGDASGVSAGPDLQSIAVEESTGQVRYTFDKAVDDRESYDTADFTLIDESGDVVEADSFVEVDGDSVLLNFNRASAQAADSLSVEAGAVQDFSGNPNPANTQGL
ncbi:hypothetical protein [Haloechinothrix sp. LS1_15]|uniref:hypothetical protein n=1 Tax=Haloechinothrix sp. LS1_15 TaxID=2652248 RepID=UPI002944BD4F|nr:hypothetical protein [Haloechinothrix sp. LS1_15]MDV6013616.1 hypothetical protein [Haloechinothrix sp. LS1_15]